MCGKELRMARSKDTVFALDEAAEDLRRSRSTLYKLAQEGKRPGQKVGRHWRFHREAVDECLGRSNTPPIGETGGNRS